MFIATSACPNISLCWERNPAAEPSPEQAKAIVPLRSFGVKKGPSGYKHLAHLGRSDKQCSCTSNLNSLVQIIVRLELD